MIAEVRTKNLGSLTYTRSRNEAEDITLFDRRRRRNISVYASPEKLATRGRFYSEDDLVDYDVLDYDLDVVITPERRDHPGQCADEGEDPRCRYDHAELPAQREPRRQLASTRRTSAGCCTSGS